MLSQLSCVLTLCDCSLPGPSTCGIFQTRKIHFSPLEWVAISSSSGSSQPRDQTHVSCPSCTAWQILNHWALQCSCLENPRDGGAWWAAVHGVEQSRTRLKWLSSSSSTQKIELKERWKKADKLFMLFFFRSVMTYFPPVTRLIQHNLQIY